MLTTGNLLSSFFELRKRAPHETLKGVLYTSAISFVAMFLSMIFFAIPLAILITYSMDNQPASQGTVELLLLFYKGLYRFLVPLFIAFAIVATSYASLKLLNNESIKASLLVKESGRFAFSSKGIAFALFYAVGTMLSSVGYLLLIIPGVIMMNVLAISLLRLIDTRCSFNQALSFAWETIKENIVSSTIFLSLVSLLVILSSIFSLFILAPFSIAFNVLAAAVYYGKVTNKPYFAENNTIE